MGRTAEAESTYRRAIAIEPSYVYARVNLGRLYGIRGRNREALRILQEAQRLEPDRVDVLTNLGTAWWALGDTARAAAAYLRALEVEPRAPVPAADLAKMRGLPPP
jgi:Flp pilus assembly protein TadD